MSAIEAPLSMVGQQCVYCNDPILRGDPVVFIRDRPLHEECEPANYEPPPTLINSSVLSLGRMYGHQVHRPLGTDLVRAGIVQAELDALPEHVAGALWLAVCAENELLELINAILGEHLADDHSS